MQVSELAIYPIKSCRGIALTQAQVLSKGFLWDREFMITNEQGQFLTQREFPQLATLGVTIDGERITLSGEAIAPLSVQTTNQGTSQEVQVWRDRTPAIDQGETVAQWLTQALALPFPVRLFRQSPHPLRIADPHYTGRTDQPVSFADAYPFLLTNTASLAELNRRLEATYGNSSQQVPMARFRPNIVIHSDHPFLEDHWQTVQIGALRFAVVKPCSRCLVTTTDQQTGQRNPLKEPLKTLNTFRNQGGQIMFGQNLIPLAEGRIAVGDPVTVIGTC
ncbi:MOSC domain-containing protein [Spirulina subsalsa FACHB-351]|uniref:MOSC domain-containing protein n=1 Tax=Spirulina subsalsa FACHB-351 TaxID=234711 RepID=A0ABT3L3C6_9CYAN|nr:MOSC N-terminal beta barrel domain-containing protein [Spirulina subsalsa]MCW6035604.1 MOSC domain-containing protein [Spirulina subsalsa FACHB-351]